MDVLRWSAGVQATAMALAACMNTEELTRTALFFTQLGTTMATIAALQGLEEGTETDTAADLTDLG